MTKSKFTVVGQAAEGVVEAWAEQQRLRQVARQRRQYNKFLRTISGGKRCRPVPVR